MFSGIVEAQAKIEGFYPNGSVRQLVIERPQSFDDINPGDSICINGVCLTVESFTSKTITFAVGPETLKVTGWEASNPLESPVNCERSLRFGDRLHGHLVTGHVDDVARVTALWPLEATLTFEIEIPSSVAPLLWKKGSLAINGVSLTINEVLKNRAQFCLIPETLKRTNLANIQVGTVLNIEADNMSRGLLRLKEVENEHHT